MRSVFSLLLEANNACSSRGHIMIWGNPEQRSERKWLATGECGNCGHTCTVNTSPSPNEIEIEGSAVALNCENKVQWKSYTYPARMYCLRCDKLCAPKDLLAPVGKAYEDTGIVYCTRCARLTSQRDLDKELFNTVEEDER